MTQEDFNDQFDDIVSSWDMDFCDWKKKELSNLFSNMKPDTIKRWVEERYNQPYGIEEGVTGEEINWVAKYFNTKAAISLTTEK